MGQGNRIKLGKKNGSVEYFADDAKEHFVVPASHFAFADDAHFRFVLSQ